MTVTINAVASTGLVQTSDGSGVVKLQSNGVTTNALAWVRFDGTTSPGTIKSQYNVSSVTKNGTGDFTVNFTNALTDANYSVIGSAGLTSGTGNRSVVTAFYSPSTTAVSVTTVVSSTIGSTDANMTSVAIFGN